MLSSKNKILVILAVLVSSFQMGFAQSYVLEVGKQYELPILLSLAPGEFSFSATVKLSNPTVFFPDGLSQTATSNISNHSLTRITDSTYTLFATVTVNEVTDTAFFLWGTALAGNDSTATIQIADLRVNDNPLEDLEIRLLTTSVGTRRPYVRFSVFDPGFPNPISSQETITFAYQIDIPSDVRFYAVTLNGTQTLIGDFKNVPFGVHRFQFTPGPLWASGNYWVMFETLTGTRYQPLHIRN